jgi:membrane protein YqaA with SNARE-associated domain
MGLFSKLYDKTLQWSQHPHAPYYLGGLSFIEASLFPIPPDIMLAPMTLSQPQKAWRYATLTTITSVIGGLFGYVLGMFFLSIIYVFIQKFGYIPVYEQAQTWFQEWGFLALFIAAFTPIPYKVFTIAAGAMSMALLPFIIASIIGRAARFYLVAGLMKWGGKPMEHLLRRYIDILGWLVFIVIGFSILIKFYFK